MSAENILVINAETMKKLQIKETVLLLGGSILLQFIIHLVPSYNNVPVGAILLPMFYAPLIAAVFFKPHVAVLTGILTPLLNYALTGFPVPANGAVLTVELLVFALAASFLLRKNNSKNVSALLALLCAKAASWMIFVSIPFAGVFTSGFFIQSFITAVPGIFVLSLLNIFLVHSKEKE